MYTMYVQILLLRHPGLFICYRILMCSLDSFSLFIQVLCGYVWGWSQWLRSTESSSRWNLPVRSRSFRSISIYLQTTQHWVCPNTHTVNSVICILQRQPPLESVLLQFSRMVDGLIIFWSNCCGSCISLFAVNCKKNNKIC